MSLSLSRICWGTLQFIERPGIRHRWIRRGKPPEIAATLAQKTAEWNVKGLDPEVEAKVNIGFAYALPPRKDVLIQRMQERRSVKDNIEMEKASKNRTLKLPLDEVYEEGQRTNGPFHVQEAADYHGVYKDLFGQAFFTPVTSLDIRFSSSGPQGEVESRVFSGNLIAPREAVSTPKVIFTPKKDVLYTIALTTPDCHFTQDNAEYLHWLVGNIPGSEVQKGQLLCDYLPPFPPRGIGHCRYVFVLYKQDKTLDFSPYQRSKSCRNLNERTFSTYDFYREYQDFMTPTGLAFFQSCWDQTLTQFYQNVLDMKEPVFEYDFPEPKLRPQQWFPVRKPFNLYMDKYKDPKQLQKELLLEKLKERHPFKPPPTPPKYPLAHRLPHSNPSWLNDDIRRRRMKQGKWKFM